MGEGDAPMMAAHADKAAAIVLLIAHIAIGAPVGYFLWRDLGWKEWIGGVLGALFGLGVVVVWFIKKWPELMRNSKEMRQSIRQSRREERS